MLRRVFGSLGVLAALAFLAGGIALTRELETHRHHYQTSSYALTTQSLDANGVWALARLRITATSSDPAKPLFVGIARTEDVDTYLADVEHDELRDIRFDPFSIDYRRLGAGAPTALPAARSIWRAHATGTGTQTISWPVEKGRWSAVVMNADGSRRVSVDAQLAARVSPVWWIFVLGGLSLLGGGALVRSAVRGRQSAISGSSSSSMRSTSGSPASSMISRMPARSGAGSASPDRATATRTSARSG